MKQTRNVYGLMAWSFFKIKDTQHPTFFSAQCLSNWYYKMHVLFCSESICTGENLQILNQADAKHERNQDKRS